MPKKPHHKVEYLKINNYHERVGNYIMIIFNCQVCRMNRMSQCGSRSRKILLQAAYVICSTATIGIVKTNRIGRGVRRFFS